MTAGSDSLQFRQPFRGIAPFDPGPFIDAGTGRVGAGPIARLSNNEAAFGPLPTALDAVRAAMVSAGSYPDDAAAELVAALAAHHGMRPEQVSVGCGSLEVLYQIAMTLIGPDSNMVFAKPSFGEYGRLCALFGGGVRPIALRDGHVDLHGLLNAIDEQTSLVVICNPHSPFGSFVEARDLRRFLDRVPPGCAVVFDEAYIEYTPASRDLSAVQLVRERPNAMVLRTFSKAYGLAGLRIGYVIAGVHVVRMLRAVHLTFSVNALAQRAATACLSALGQSQLGQRVDQNAVERARLTAALRDLGVPVLDSVTNFVFVPVGAHAETVAEGMQRCGVFVRPLPGVGLRITIGTPIDSELVVDSFAGLRRARPTSM